MYYSIEKLQDVLLITLDGDVLSKLETCQQLKDEIRVQLYIGARKFLIDLSEVASVNSVGIGAIVSTMMRVKRAEGQLKLCEINEGTKAAFAVIGALALLDVCENREEGLVSLGHGAVVKTGRKGSLALVMGRCRPYCQGVPRRETVRLKSAPILSLTT